MYVCISGEPEIVGLLIVLLFAVSAAIYMYIFFVLLVSSSLLCSGESEIVGLLIVGQPEMLRPHLTHNNSVSNTTTPLSDIQEGPCISSARLLLQGQHTSSITSTWLGTVLLSPPEHKNSFSNTTTPLSNVPPPTVSPPFTSSMQGQQHTSSITSTRPRTIMLAHPTHNNSVSYTTTPLSNVPPPLYCPPLLRLCRASTRRPLLLLGCETAAVIPNTQQLCL